MSKNTTISRPFRLYVRTEEGGLLVRISRAFTTFGAAWQYSKRLHDALNAELRKATPQGTEQLVDEFTVKNGIVTRTYTGERL